MKRLFAAGAILLCAACMISAQERRPVIGLTEIKAASSMRNSVDAQAENQVRAAISSAIVKSKRFAVMERSAEELDKIRQENLETSGTINPNSQLDFLLTGEIIEYGSGSEALGGAASEWVGAGYSMFGLKAGTTTTITIGVSIKFTDVQTGQIVLIENFSKSKKGKTNAISTNEIAQELGTEVITAITDALYPPTVLSVGKNNVLMIPNSNYHVGSVIEIYEAGEEIIDPYTGENFGSEEEFIANAVVFEVSERSAKAMVDPNGEFKDVEITRGMHCRRTTLEDAGPNALSRIQKAAKKK